MVRVKKIRRLSSGQGAMRLGNEAAEEWKKKVEKSDKRKEEDRNIVFR